MSICKNCGEDIIWAETDSGKRMPVDIYPNAIGNLRVDFTDPAHPLVHVLTMDQQREADPEDLYLSHFVTCLKAASHRRPKPPRQAKRPKRSLPSPW